MAIQAIIINYICRLTQTRDTSIGIVSSIEQARVWGQVSGIFTESPEVLKSYNYDYLDSESYRIFNHGSTTNDAVYKTENLFDVIKEETQKQVEDKRNTTFALDSNGQLTDGKIYYSFVSLILLDIEADEGTSLRIGQSKDGSDAVNIQIGPTCRYTINPSTSLVNYIAFEHKNADGTITRKPQFAVVNYKCVTQLLTLVYLEE